MTFLSSAFNLLYKVDLPGTEARIAAFIAHNSTSISANQLLLEREAELTAEREAAEREERSWRRDQSRRTEEEREREREKKRIKVLQELEFSSRDVGAIVQEAQVADEDDDNVRAAPPPPPSFMSRLKKRTAPQAPAGPLPPYRDPYDSYESLFTLLPDYVDPATAGIREDAQGVFRAGGFRVSEVWERAVRGAVCGLGVAVLRGDGEEELSGKVGEGTDSGQGLEAMMVD